jgi:putative hemolysin
MELTLLLFLIFLNGAFAMSEIAIVTAKKAKLSALRTQGRRGAERALILAEDSTQFLSTVQVGITSIGILSGIIGEAVLAEPFGHWLHDLGLSDEASANLATALVVIVITYFSIVIGELVPKRIGQINAEPIACIVSRPMHWLSVFTRPIVRILSLSTSFLIKVLGVTSHQNQSVTEEEIQALLHEGSVSGIIEKQEHQMLKNVLRLDDRPLRSVMVPRADVVFLDTNSSLEINLERIAGSPHSIFPLCDKSLDNVIGIVRTKDLLPKMIAGEAIHLSELAIKAKFVLENLSALDLLEYFKSSATDMVFILDEYGDIPGIITLQDVVEAMTGEFNTESEDPYVISREDGSFLIDGAIPILDLKDCLQIHSLPYEDQYHTLNGLILKLLEKIPATGDKFQLSVWEFEVIDMDGRKVDKVLVQRRES